ncbi:IS5 family transposase [Acinetobacter johnsonii]|uniref:IS5 family transposase n=1 Tax=Acinetobacter johnsonii TaxID=40214 RepID=UPI0021CD7A3E|nr:IS5 family transposase [Acinetobacter johnsonii]
MKKPTHKIYRTTNWPAYNRALMSRGNIAIWFDPATQWYAPSKGKQGRNQTYSDAAIQCCLMIKSLFRLSLRMVTGFVQSLIKLCGLNWIAPDYTTLCRRQKHIDIVISYQKSSDGLHLLMDSTGMKFLGEGEWKRKKHGPEYRRQWRKLHIGKLINNHIDQDPTLKQDLKLLQTIPSIGERSGLLLLGLFHSHKFEKASQAAAYVGLVPVHQLSGSSVNKQSHLSKASDSKIRSVLYMSALTAIKYNPHIEALYQRLLSRGKNKMCALGAAMCKLIHLCYGVLKHQTAYQRDYLLAE